MDPIHSLQTFQKLTIILILITAMCVFHIFTRCRVSYHHNGGSTKVKLANALKVSDLALELG